jgi:3-phenylpropionate/trans-cinnamate dioxygenase ferredoxin reductase subunit
VTDNSQPNEVVIVGGGLAGANAAFALRDLGFAGSLNIVGEEAEIPYERPPLSKGYLRGEEPREKAQVRPVCDYADNQIRLVVGRRATDIDTDRQLVTLDDRTSLRYDALLLATGSAPRRLDVPGADWDGVFYLRNVGDSDAIREAAAQSEVIVVVGGGWLGTEVAASLRQLGRSVALVAPPPQPLEQILGSEAAAAFTKLHEENGTRLVTGRVVEIVGDGTRRREVLLADGTRIPADMVVAAVGAAPRIQLADACGLMLRDGGVQVDQFLRSSVPNVFVAGDIATAWNPRFSRFIRSEHWDNAIEQGKAAAANILGRKQPYNRSPYFFSDQFDLGMEYRGYAQAWDRVVIRGDVEAREFDAFWLKDGRVIAAMNVNRWDDAAELQDLVDRQAEVDPEQVALGPVAAS